MGYDPIAPPPSYAVASSLSSPLVPVPPSPTTSLRSPTTARHQSYQHEYAHLNLPSGLFLVRNRSTGKTLDLLGHHTHHGAQIGAHPVKQPQLRGLDLIHKTNNQLFFLDWNGHLTAAAASHTVDVQGDQLILAHPRPIQTYPSPLSHPIPRFALDPTTSTLQVLFSHDPDYPPPLRSPSTSSSSYKDYDYLVEIVPLRSKTRRRRQGETAMTSGVGTVLNQVGKTANNVVSGIFDRVSGGGRRTSGSTTVTMANIEEEGEKKTKVHEIKKKLPRDREASLPPPPPPSKSPPPLPSPSIRSRHSVSHSTNDSVVPGSSALSTKSTIRPFDSPDDHSRAQIEVDGTSQPHDRLLESPENVSPSTTRVDDLPHRDNDPRSIPSDIINDDDKPSEDELQSEFDDDESICSSSDEDSDSELSAFRPVRIVKLLRNQWREEFPFEALSTSTMSNRRGGETTRRREGDGIGLGFGGEGEEEDGEERGEVIENVWPESIHHHHHKRMNGTHEADRRRENGNGDSTKTKKEKVRFERKEVRKWRRRQWDIVPVTVEPVPVRTDSRSQRVLNESEEDMYGFSTEIEEEEERLGEGVEESNSVRGAGVRDDRKLEVGGGGASVRSIAQSAVSVVGSFLPSWGRRTSEPNSTSSDLPPLPHSRASSSRLDPEEDVLDAEEVRSEEIAKLAAFTHHNHNNPHNSRRKSSTTTTRSLHPAYAVTGGEHDGEGSDRVSLERRMSNLPPSPPLPNLPSVPATDVPLPASVPTTPQVTFNDDETTQEDTSNSERREEVSLVAT